MNEWFRGAVGMERTGLAALAIFAFLAPQGHAGAKWGLLLLILAALPYWRDLIRDQIRDPLFHVVCLFGLYLVVRAAFASRALPDTAAEQWDAALGFGQIGFYVLLVSWWLRADQRRVALLGGLAVFGLCIEILADGRWVDLDRVLRGAERNMVGSALPTGLLGGLGLLVIIIALPVAIDRAARYSREVLISLSVIALLAIILMAALQVLTQSRAIVGMLVVLVPIILIIQLKRSAHDRKRRGTLSFIACVLAIVLGGVIALIGPKLIDKMDRELNQVLPYLDSGRLAEMPSSSLGYRVQLIDLGIDVGTDRPWVGWGPGTSTTRHLLERYNRKELAHLHHLHNSPLEIWVRLGAVGLLLYLAVLICILNAAIKGVKAGRMPGEITIFVIAASILIAGFSLIEFRLLSWDFMAGLIAVAAVAHTFGAWENTSDDSRRTPMTAIFSCSGN